MYILSAVVKVVRLYSSVSPCMVCDTCDHNRQMAS